MKRVKFWTDQSKIEISAMEQIEATTKHPLLFNHLAVMPDVHAGIGCTIGSVIPIKNAVIPAAVGVDIGCGMCAVSTGAKLEQLSGSFDLLHNKIVSRIPLGFSHRSQEQMRDCELFLEDRTVFEYQVKHYQSVYPNKDIYQQIGTLGGGNHFIELQVDDSDYVWIMIHSGSRNIGNKIATTYIKRAKDTNHDPDVPKDMEFLLCDEKVGMEYLTEMQFALTFALMNRELMIEIVKDEIAGLTSCGFGKTINIHHNYASKETHFGEDDIWVHRKGATKAVSTALGIIPGSMGTASYIVRGKDCADSYNSCSHGAGRVMSRTQAKGKWDRKKQEFKSNGILSVSEFESDMLGVFSKSVDRQHLDEAPRAYKDIDVVMENQRELIDIEVKLKPVFNIKG